MRHHETRVTDALMNHTVERPTIDKRRAWVPRKDREHTFTQALTHATLPLAAPPTNRDKPHSKLIQG